MIHIMENAQKINLDIPLKFTIDAWVHLDDYYPDYFRTVVPDYSIDVVLVTYYAEGKYFFSIDEFYSAVRYSQRTGKKDLILPDGSARRQKPELIAQYPMAKKIPSILPTGIVPRLRTDEIKLLTNPYQVKDPDSKRPRSVYPLKLLSVVSRIYDHALREHDAGNMKLTVEQQVRAIILLNLNDSLSEEALTRRLRLKTGRSLSIFERQREAFLKNNQHIVYENRLFEDEDYAFGCYLLGTDWDPEDPCRYKSKVFVARFLARLAYSFLDEQTLNLMRDQKKNGIPLHCYLNSYAISHVQHILLRLRQIARLYSYGDFKAFVTHMKSVSPGLALDDHGCPVYGAELDEMIRNGEFELLPMLLAA